MVKLFGFRISKMLFILLTMELLVLCLSIVLAVFLYLAQQQPLGTVETDVIHRTMNQTSFFILFLLLLSPGLFIYIHNIFRYQTWMKEVVASVVLSTLAMVVLYLTFSPAGSQGFFVIAILSASVGITLTKLTLLYQRWRFLAHKGMD